MKLAEALIEKITEELNKALKFDPNQWVRKVEWKNAYGSWSYDLEKEVLTFVSNTPVQRISFRGIIDNGIPDYDTANKAISHEQ